MSARVRQVIETELEKRGDGTEQSPVRIVRQYWSVEGDLLAAVDPQLAPVLGELRQSLETRGEASLSTDLCQRLLAALPRGVA